MEKLKIFVDMDGTLTNETEGFGPEVYSQRTPNPFIIGVVNNYYDQGHDITIYTARYHQDREVTAEWLNKYGVKYHNLILGKPQYDIMIDDNSVNPRFLEKIGGYKK